MKTDETTVWSIRKVQASFRSFRAAAIGVKVSRLAKEVEQETHVIRLKYIFTHHSTLTACIVLLAASISKPINADDSERAELIGQLSRIGRLDLAKARYQSALEEYPDSPKLAVMAQSIASGFNREFKYEEAAQFYYKAGKHLAAKPISSPNSTSLTSMHYIALRMYGCFSDSGKPELSIEPVKNLISILEKNRDKRSQVEFELDLAELRSILTKSLAASGKADEANRLQAVYFDAAQKRFNESPSDLAVQKIYLTWLSNAYSVHRLQGDQQAADRASQKFTSFLKTQAITQANDGNWVERYTEYTVMSFTTIVDYKSPKHVKEVFTEVFQTLDEIESATTDERVKELVESTRDRLGDFGPSIDAAVKREVLVGKQHPVLKLSAFVNGERVTEADLKDKVVLLYFCDYHPELDLAALDWPIEEWEKKYKSEDFFVLGVTQYNKYDWDQFSFSDVKNSKLSKEQERAAWERYAQYATLNHVIAFSDDDSNHKEYLVTGTPHVVLIDRKGIIRMIRGARYGYLPLLAFEEKLQELIAEK